MIAVVAMALKNRAIGLCGGLPWHLPEDLRWFKEVTMGGTLLMGRVTYESIGRPLPGRDSIVMTRQEGLDIPGVRVIRNLGELREKEVRGEVYVIGGADIFAQTLPYLKGLYMTEVLGDYEGDRFFPPFEDAFLRESVIRETPNIRIVYYANKNRLELPVG